MLPRVADYLRAQGAAFDVALSASAQDLERSAGGAAEAGYTHVAALGGDGTVHYVLNGAAGTRVALGILPVGNGNDIALGLGIPTEPLTAAHTFLYVPWQPVDVVRLRSAEGRTRLFIGAGGLGMDAEAARLVHGPFRRLPGVIRYVVAGLWALRHYQPLEVTATLDGRTWRGTVLLAAAANAPTYGAGMKIAPAARMDDGWIEIVVVGDLAWTRVVEALFPVLRTGDLRLPEIHRFRARRASFEASRPAIFHADGELLGELPVEMEVMPGSVRVAGARPRPGG